jgi:hypothetical protein
VWFGVFILMIIFWILGALGDYCDRFPHERQRVANGIMLVGLLLYVSFLILFCYSVNRY